MLPWIILTTSQSGRILGFGFGFEHMVYLSLNIMHSGHATAWSKYEGTAGCVKDGSIARNLQGVNQRASRLAFTLEMAQFVPTTSY